jgi:hypothetical protein
LKIHEKFSSSDAIIVVFLHENHKKYFSSHSDTFLPFTLNKTREEHRNYIKNYFQIHFQVILSVRPSFKKFIQANKIYFFYHAQIQA